jgi:hypothetical protein
MPYVLLDACPDSENLYAVRSIVSKLENDVTQIDVYPLNAVKGKKQRPLYPLLAARLLQSKKKMQTKKRKGECRKGLLPMPQGLHPPTVYPL